MKNITRFFVSTILIFAFFANALPCGPAYVSPIFEYEHAPENPYENFAAGKLGILKPTQRRVVLIGAYRYLIGGGFSQSEQKSLVDVWNAEFKNKPFEEENISETVKSWIEKRKSVVGKEEKTPEIYVERPYEGGYDFFPNCTKNAFETAEKTLSDRIASHGSDDKDVLNWVKAQDSVFENCASGKATPDAPNDSMSDWLQKDRAYQIAAADFYSLDYDSAKRHFKTIALDSASPWQETAEYLVGRTLLRQASLTKDREKTNALYAEAEQNLSNIASKGGKFANSADKLLGLIKYRIHPQDRVRELAQIIATQDGENFRQDLVDYNWLLDKFEKESLEAESARQLEKKRLEDIGNSNTNANVAEVSPTNVNTEQTQNDGELKIYFYSDDYKETWSFSIKTDATDDEAIAKAETVVGKPLSDKMKEQVRAARKTAYTERYSQNREPEYEGGYYGSETTSLGILPDFLRLDDLTNWLFAFQVQGNEAYLYAMSQWRQTNSVLWLMTAISKADKSSSELNSLLEATDKISRDSAAYPTIAYHKARILMELGKSADAKKLLDDILNSGADLPISARNMFLGQRIKLADTLEDFLKFAQLKPFAFDFDGESGTIDQFIADEKSWYSPESYPDQTREQYEKEVEARFADQKTWENRSMFDTSTIELMNQHFPLPVLAQAEKSPALPDYLRERFAVAVWTRAALLDDFVTADKIAPELIGFHPEFKDFMDKIFLAKTPLGKKRAVLFFILKNPVLSPYLADSFDKSDNEFGDFDANDWWCSPYDTEYDDATGTEVKAKLPPRPLFLTAAQTNNAQDERAKLKLIGDAPKFMGEKVLEWARLAPNDARIPESLYIVWEANGWTKYGCGNNEELRAKISSWLKKKYPTSEWTQKVSDTEKEQQ